MAYSADNAVLDIGRLNYFRLNYLTPELQAKRDRLRRFLVKVTLDGVPLRVRVGSMTIYDAINDAPNTCALVVDAATPPTVGQRLRVEYGDPARLLFVGPLLRAVRTYVGRPAVLAWTCDAIDDTARSEWRLPFGAWNGVSATTVAQALVTLFAPGFTAHAVQANLPPVTLTLDGTEGLNAALRLIAKLIGGYFYWEDYDLHLFLDAEAGETPDAIDGTPGRLLDEPPITITSDDAQIRTRCYGKGHSEPMLTEVAALEVKLPIETAVMFNPFGGQAIIESQRLTYTGTDLGGTGALVGPGVTPSSPPVAAPVAGAGITGGAHNYAFTWVTPAGETLPSPVAAVTVGGSIPAPVLDAAYNGGLFGGPPAGTVMRYQLFIHDQQNLSPGSNILTLTSDGTRPIVSFRTNVDMRNLYVLVYRSDNGGGWFSIAVQGLVPGFADPFPPNQGVGLSQNWTDVTVTSDPNPPFNVGQLTRPARVQLSGVSVGPAATTARRVYRTAAGVTALKLLTTLADNVTTTYLDAAADGALGAAAPVTDTSALQMAAGQVVVGATTMPVSSTAWARSDGGWLIIGNGQQVIRYGGITGNTLTGIPASGIGAIVAPVNYNSTVTGAPMLIGVTGLGFGVREGAPVAIWVQRDDVPAQQELAARIGGAGAGIIEHLIVDERRGEPSLIALCDADLVMYSRPIVTVKYTCFDPKSRSGKPVRIFLPSLGIDLTLTIQDVTIDALGLGAAVPARFAVTASSLRLSLEDLLRRMVGTLEEGF